MTERQLESGETTMDIRYQGRPFGVTFKDFKVLQVHVGSVASHITAVGDAIQSVDGVPLAAQSEKDVQKVNRAHAWCTAMHSRGRSCGVVRVTALRGNDWAWRDGRNAADWTAAPSWGSASYSAALFARGVCPVCRCRV